jgi:two-component system NtrC family response regulator
MSEFKILIIDDEESQREPIAGFLRKQGYNVVTAGSCDIGMNIFRKENINLILSDLKMPEKTGLDVINEAKGLNPDIPIIISTAYGDIDGAVDLMRSGARDFMQKPIDLEELLQKIKIIKEEILNNEDLEELHKKIEQNKNAVSFEGIISKDKKITEIMSLTARIAPSKAAVMIRGESGTGKELIARAIHDASDRSDKPFIVVNCAAIPDTLFESELFGHEKGAFTGATKQKAGKFELADGGTLFIDEVGDIPLQVQVKLLRTVQFGIIERLGSEKSIELNVRIISATHKALEQMITNREFREDLFYRMNVVEIELPPLRKRKKDIPLLIEYFLHKFSKENNKEIVGITNEAKDMLMKFDYPGNIRQLENIIQRAVVIARENVINADDLPQLLNIKNENNDEDCDLLELGDLNEKVEMLESTLIKNALDECEGNQSKAAKMLNISERTIRYKIKKYDIN